MRSVVVKSKSHNLHEQHGWLSADFSCPSEDISLSAVVYTFSTFIKDVEEERYLGLLFTNKNARKNISRNIEDKRAKVLVKVSDES